MAKSGVVLLDADIILTDKAYAVEKATEYLFAAGNYELDLSLIQTYLQNLTIYPVSTRVMLNTGQLAYVVETQGRPVMRPMVQV